MYSDPDIRNPWGIDYYEVPSNPSVSYGNFQNEIYFPFTTPSESWVVPRMSYISLKLRIVYCGASAATALLNSATGSSNNYKCLFYLCNNIVGGLFRSARVLIDGTEISNIQDYGSASTLYNMCFSNQNVESTVDSINKIELMNSTDMDTILIPTVNATNPATTFRYTNGREEYAKRCTLIFNSFNENEICANLFLPLFLSENLIPPNVKCEVRLTVDPSYEYNIVQWTDELATNYAGTSISKLTAASAPAGTTRSVLVGCGGAALQLYRLKYYNPGVDMVANIRNIKLKQMYSQIVPLVGSSVNTTMSIPAQRHVTHILAGFIHTSRGSYKKSTTDFTAGFTNANPEVKNTYWAGDYLKSIKFTYKGQRFPDPAYNLDTSASTNSNNLLRAFAEFMNMSEHRLYGNGSLFDFNKWMDNKVFCFRTDGAFKSNDTNIYVNCEFSHEPTDSTLLVVLLYEETLRLTYSNGILAGKPEIVA